MSQGVASLLTPVHTHDGSPALVLPLGGIGTGNLGLASDGGFRQWQLHNVGNHRGDLFGSLFALRIQRLEPTLSSTMILQAPTERVDPVPLITDGIVPDWQRDLVREVGGVKGVEMQVTYPVGELRYDTGNELDVTLRALTPMQPGDAEFSGVPTATFEFTLTNTSSVLTRTWLFGALQNAVGLAPHINPVGVQAAGYGGNVNQLVRGGGASHLVMTNPSVSPAEASSGSMVLSVLDDRALAFPQYLDPRELVDFMNLVAPWGDHSKLDRAPWVQAPQNSAPALRYGPSPEGQTWLGALGGFAELQPGETKTIRFAISWHFPNRYVDFVQFGGPRPEHGPTKFWLGNEYAQRFGDARAVADSVVAEWDEYWSRTHAWVDKLNELDLTEVERQHFAAQAVPLRSPTCFRTADGAFFGFEGTLGASTNMWSGDVGGSCPLNCTHVWNYSMAVASLYPSLEASMRDTEYDVMLAPNGSLPHRVYMPTYLPQLWEGNIGGPERPALDGMLGMVLKTYRELRSGAVDEVWLRRRWPKLTLLMDHVADGWDPDDTGILQGEQPSTYDIGLNGANPYIGTFWLAALRAAEEMAKLVGEDDRAQAWRARFEKSSQAYDERMFKHGYYIQVPDESLGWADQWGEGCLADQLIGQWWAHTLDLGYLLPKEHVHSALRNIVEHNFAAGIAKPQMQQRIYCLPDEQGLALASWPHGGRPEVPTLYCDEVWTGIEYQVAAHCFYEGFDDLGHQILDAMWQRHDGSRRSPLNEIECGDHYVRSMAGWSVLEARFGRDWLTENRRNA